MNKIVAYLLTPLVVLTLIACAQEKKSDNQGTKGESPVSESVKAPAFMLKDGQGNDVKLAVFNGKVIILDFWATWCPPCRMEIPHFIELQKEYGEKGLQVIGISVDQEGWKVVTPFIEEQGINYPILLTDQKTYLDYQKLLPPGLQGSIPFTFILDRQGNVSDQVVGYREKNYFESKIKSLLEI